MQSYVIRLIAVTSFLLTAARVADADVCITIDQGRDALQASERTAAIMLLGKQFEIEGERVVASGCQTTYKVFHARLGNLIVVNISGPGGEREAMASGMEDLPALYSQMVRSIVTGRPLSSLAVVDRTNVTELQTTARRYHSDAIWYGRLGYGSIFGDQAYGTPSLGFGFRGELDSFGIDVSFLNYQFRPSDDYYSSYSHALSTSLLKLSGLYFLNPRANSTAYFGGGLSYGTTMFGTRDYRSPDRYRTEWDGSGLQGELTIGYELARATSLRMFVQADAVLPFYKVTSETYSVRSGPISSDRRYAPSLVVSVGIGR